MKKDIKWLKAEVEKQDIIMDKGHIYTSNLIYLIDQLDEPEVLSQKWIEEHTYYEDEYDFYYADPDELKNLLVPKQEELESKIKVLIEAYKQEDGAYSNPEDGWISGFVEDLENLVEEKPLYYALIKGHELVDDYDIYWNCDKSDYGVFVSRLHPPHDNFLTEMSKEEWNKLGINESNADFVKADE